MKKILKNQKAISLMTLSITIVIILIITNVTLYNVGQNLGIQNVKKLQSDIENLRQKVSEYYLQKGSLPILQNDNSYSILEEKEYMPLNETDTMEEFYVINLSLLDNLTLNYGKDFENIKDENIENVENYKDLYIINENSHNIFYVKGIKYNNQMYYTDYTTEDKVSFSIENNGDVWSSEYLSDAWYTDSNGQKVKIPKGFMVSRNSSQNTIADGLVIKNDNNDSYVWIRVPESVFKTAVSNTDYEGIKKDILEYTKEYNEDSSNSVDSNDSNVENEILKSIYDNKGFWVGQYEVGTSSQRNESSTDDDVAVIQEKKNVYNYISAEKAKNKAESLYKQEASNDTEKTNSENVSRKSSLMLGEQWNLILKFIEVREKQTKEKLVEDSSSWGNYDENQGIINTGSNKNYCILNIYDLAGNLSEFTLENDGNGNLIPIARGGMNPDSTSETDNAGSVKDKYNYSNSSKYIGFRVCLYDY